MPGPIVLKVADLGIPAVIITGPHGTLVVFDRTTRSDDCAALLERLDYLAHRRERTGDRPAKS